MTTQGQRSVGVSAVDPESDYYRVLVDSVSEYAIIGLDPQGVVTSWNRGAQRLKRYERDEIVGQHFSIFYTPEDRAAALPLHMLDQARAAGRVEHSGWRVRKDGSLFWADVAITALVDDTTRCIGFAKVTRDLTERHLADAELRQSESRFRLLVDSVLDYAFIGLDPQGVVTTWNRGAQRLNGYTESEIVGRHFSTFYTAEDRAKGYPIQVLDEARAHGRTEHTGWRMRKDGTLFWGDVVLTAVHDENGVLTGFAKLTRDQTAEHSAQERLEHALGRFAELAHDLRQPLNVIRGYTTLLQDQVDENAQDLLAHVETASTRMMQMAENILDLSRLTMTDRALAPVAMPLAEALERAAALVEPGTTRTIETAIPPELVVVADPAALDRIMVNLLANALKHSTDGAPVSVSAAAGDDTVMISVADRGPGIPAHMRSTLFEPFMADGRAGSIGLGLNIARRYVELHGGSIAALDREGGGTIMRVTLPGSATRAEPAPPAG